MGEEISVFSQRLRDSRVMAGYTQKQLAEELGISSGSVIAYEKSQKIPSIDVCVKFATFFNVSLDWLCGLADDMKHYEIRTYGDAFRMIVALHRWIGVSCKEPEYVETEDGDLHKCRDWSIDFWEKPLNEAIDGWQKVKELYDAGTIDREIYDLWVEKQLRTLDDEYTPAYLNWWNRNEGTEEPETEDPDKIFGGGETINADDSETR